MHSDKESRTVTRFISRAEEDCGYKMIEISEARLSIRSGSPFVKPTESKLLIAKIIG